MHALLHFKHGSVVPRQTRPYAPATFPFLMTIDWSVNHSLQKIEGVHGSHILIPLVQYVTGYIHKPRDYFDYKPSFPIVLYYGCQDLYTPVAVEVVVCT
jgi:hypothetical protein